MRKILLTLLALSLTSSTLPAQTYTPDLSAISFPNSGAPAAQHEFLLGLFQLHNFEYADAAQHFRAAQKTDPHFALAYWGEAMTFNHTVWHEQDQAAALAALNRPAEARTAFQAALEGSPGRRRSLSLLASPPKPPVP